MSPMSLMSEQLYKLFAIADRKHRFTTYPKVFIGSDAVKSMLTAGIATSEDDAIAIGNALIEEGVFSHVTRDHSFKNEHLFYRFAVDDKNSHGEKKKKTDGESVSWANFLRAKDSTLPTNDNMQPMIRNAMQLPQAGDLTGDDVWQHADELEVFPLDEHNAKLLDCVHPKEWINPHATTPYNLVVVGAGAGGLISSIIACGVGARVALIEQHLMGGDCLNVGCVPSKALIKAAKVAHSARNAAKYGVNCADVSVDFGFVMQRLRKIRANIAPNDSAERYARAGVDVFIGHAEFLDPQTILVNDQHLKFSKAVIATGATAAIPSIDGIENIPFFTNSNVFNMTVLPKTIAVIGAGPIGCELAQSFQRLGASVTMFNRSARVLDKEDIEASNIVCESMKNDGVTFCMPVTFKQFKTLREAAPDEGRHYAEVLLSYEDEGIDKTFTCEAVIIATGRKPNIVGLGLEKAKVTTNRSGVIVDDNLRTSSGHIFAVGDVCCSYKFTHVADFMARIVVRNALFFGRDKFSSLLIPWATYTEPEVAHVGLYERDLDERKISYDIYRKEFEHNDRAICDSDTSGFVKILTKKGDDKILGATIVACNAGDMISEVTVAMTSGLGLSTLANCIHPYPTRAECIRQCGDLYNGTRLTPFVKSIFRGLMTVRR